MLNDKTLYLEIHRQRTHERLIINLLNALETIKKYDEKQQFMNMLGQDTFWKKNRLDLWRALSQDSVERYTLKDEDKVKNVCEIKMTFVLSEYPFQNSFKKDSFDSIGREMGCCTYLAPSLSQ